jgi:hypothetical protein
MDYALRLRRRPLVAQAVEATKSLDHDKLADYIHSHKFSTVAGEIAFRQGRRVDEVTAVLHPISGCERERSRDADPIGRIAEEIALMLRGRALRRSR